jgi:drug/metabolite transporter (DMT)-like permease
VITFFTGIQYIFLTDIEASNSRFAFLTVTSLIGFLIVFAAFFSELFRINKRQMLQSLLLAAEMFLFNICLLFGSSDMNPAVVSFAMTGYLIFIPVIYIFMKKKLSKTTLLGTVVVLLGLALALELSPSGLADFRLFFLLAADVFFALYIVTVEYVSVKSNPSILAMGRMFFSFLFALIGWIAEIVLTDQDMTLPADNSFWSSVMFISIFVGGFYCVIQIYAQRYVSAMDAALIFSTETVITLLMAPLILAFAGETYEPVTILKLAGCVVIVVGVLIADGSILATLRQHKKVPNEKK